MYYVAPSFVHVNRDEKYLGIAYNITNNILLPCNDDARTGVEMSRVWTRPGMTTMTRVRKSQATIYYKERLWPAGKQHRRRNVRLKFETEHKQLQYYNRALRRPMLGGGRGECRLNGRPLEFKNC